jgi:DNA invertase Pin-like site-specific DNA recombinase
MTTMDGEQCNGRPFFNGRGQVREMKAQEPRRATEIAKVLGIGRASVYRVLEPIDELLE